MMPTTDPQPVQITVDAASRLGPLAHNWNYIGYDECNYTYTPEGQALLAKFQALQHQPTYVRTHHLFCTGNCHGFYKWGSTNVYTEDEEGTPVYTWRYIDLILDTTLRYGCRPFVELGFMPMDLVDTTYYDQVPGLSNRRGAYDAYRQFGWSCPPKDYTRWYDLVHAFVTHCVERYGADEVRTWYFELWNEPDIFYWAGSHEDFYRLYDYTAAAVKAAFPEARVGGPGVTNPARDRASGQMLDGFLAHCRAGINAWSGEAGAPLDFTTFHVKGGGYPMDIKARKGPPPSVKRILQGVATGYAIIRAHGYEGLECILSEIDPDGWAAGGVGDNSNFEFRNTETYPSFVVDAFDKVTRYAQARAWDLRLLTWAFLFVGERCFEGTRAFSTQGIDKAILNLFRLEAQMGPIALTLESTARRDPLSYADMHGLAEPPDVDGFAALTEGSRVDVLIYSHHDDWDRSDRSRVTLTVKGLPFDVNRHEIAHYRIDAAHSNAYAEWLRQGSPMYPTAAQRAALEARAGLERVDPPTVVPSAAGTRSVWTCMTSRRRSRFTCRSRDVGNSGALRLTFDLPAHAVSLLTLTAGDPDPTSGVKHAAQDPSSRPL